MFELNLEGLTQEQLNSIKKQIEEFEKENEKPKDVIDYVNGWIADGDIGSCTDEYSHMGVDNMHSLGLYRDTEEECEKLIKKMKIEHRLRQWSKMCKDKVDWSDKEQDKYYIYKYEDSVITKTYNQVRCNDVYFTDSDVLQKAIADIGRDKLTTEYFVEV
jgi:hypothetical protein